MPRNQRTASRVLGPFLMVLLAASFATAQSRGPKVAESRGAEWIDLVFVTHLDVNVAEQDVFVERVPGSGRVYRVAPGDHDIGAPLYRAAHAVERDPFNDAAVGPFLKGEPLGFTVGDWLKHRGTGRYTCDNGVGILEAEFSGLVPTGVYTIWHAFMAKPSSAPFSGMLELPLGARDGSTSDFVAGADGRATYEHSFSPCLEMSDVWTISMLAITYHSDGRTYGADPGMFGVGSHIPLFVLLPSREGLR